MTDLSHLDSIVDDPDAITEVVLKAMSDTDDGRLKQIVDALVRHAHAFFREVQLTDQEFEKGLEFVKAIGQATVDDHNAKLFGGLDIATDRRYFVQFSSDKPCDL